MRWAGRGARIGELRIAYKILVRKPHRNRPLRRDVGLGEIGREDVD